MEPAAPVLSIPPHRPSRPTATLLFLLLLINATSMLIGAGSSILLRLYFLHGGSRLWLSSFLQYAGFPLLLIPISLSSFVCNRRPFQLPPSVFTAAASLGLLFGLDGYLYGYGTSYLPLSTSSILMSCQLAFTALFSFVIVRQRFTAYTINAIVLLTIGPVSLGLGASKDRPAGESNRQYILGFVMTLLAAALVGLALPSVERMYKLVKEGVSYWMVMEIQFVVGASAAGFSLVGMAASGDFQAMAREAREFGLGEVKYYVVTICTAILFQLAISGLLGVVSCSSSLLGGVLNAVILPIQEILAVIFFREKFNGSKGIALVLYMWGFSSYLYGERKKSKEVKKAEVDLSGPSPQQ